MTTAIYETAITDTLKVSAYFDEDNYPLEDLLGPDSETGLFILPRPAYSDFLSLWQTKEHSQGPKTATLLEITRQFFDNGNLKDYEAALLKHLARDGYVAQVHTISGSSQGDYLTVIFYDKKGYLSGMVETFRAWFSGEIYTVSLEALETYKSATGKVLTLWEAVESIGGMMLETGDRKELLGIAKDYFAISDKAAA